MTDPIRLGYLVSESPAVSHTFVLREILLLRARNFDLKVASINRPARAGDRMTDVERAEAAQTVYVKDIGLGRIAWAHLATLRRSPRGYLRGLGFALRLGGFDLKRILFMFFYFIEAVVIGAWMYRCHRNHL